MLPCVLIVIVYDCFYITEIDYFIFYTRFLLDEIGLMNT
jgi:hypothetical protein